MSIGDKIFNKLTGRKVETIKIDQDQAINLIQELFIDPADSDKELDEIYKLISFIGIGIGGSSSEIISKDNRFRLFRNNELGAGSIISIGDLENEKEFDKYLLENERIYPYSINREYLPIKALDNIDYMIKRK